METIDLDTEDMDVQEVLDVNLDDSENPASEHTFIVDLDGMEREYAEMKYLLILEMFPDVEPVFLEAKCTELALDNSKFDEFLESTMISGNYPKKAPKTDLSPLAESIARIYSNGFNLEAFLKKYPEPDRFFSNLDGSRHLQFSYVFLQNRYRSHLATTIRLALQKSAYNLAMTDLKLSKTRATRKVPRRLQDIKPPEGVPPVEFLDVVDFVENRQQISQYLKDKAVARQNAVEEARKASALLTCGCCFSDDLLAEEVSTCSEGHIFCKSCILRSVEVLMGDSKTDFPCLQECTGNFSLKTLKELLPVNTFEKLEKKIQEEEILSANIPGLETCAFCEYSAIPPEEDRIFNCDLCKKKTCRLCRRECHIPYSCAEVVENDEKEKDRLTVEEKMTDALLRTCWRCKKKFIREDGCNKMTCVCGASMCYICRKPVRDYTHFTDRANIGVVVAGMCPLWTSNKSLHHDEVIRQGRRAIDDLKRKNPELEELLHKKKR